MVACHGAAHHGRVSDLPDLRPPICPALLHWLCTWSPRSVATRKTVLGDGLAGARQGATLVSLNSAGQTVQAEQWNIVILTGQPIEEVAGVEGLEPPALGFGDRCSTN